MNNIYRFIILWFTVGILACTTTKKANNNVQEVERIQNNTLYSAVDSEWNELYQ